MFDKHVVLFKRTCIEQNLQPLPSSQFALIVLYLNAVFAAPGARRRAFCLELAQDILHEFASSHFGMSILQRP